MHEVIARARRAAPSPEAPADRGIHFFSDISPFCLVGVVALWAVANCLLNRADQVTAASK